MGDGKGAAAIWMSRNVYIVSEVVIGANAMIYPGISAWERVYRGARAYCEGASPG